MKPWYTLIGSPLDKADSTLISMITGANNRRLARHKAIELSRIDFASDDSCADRLAVRAMLFAMAYRLMCMYASRQSKYNN